jgi:hypothetical protein
MSEEITDLLGQQPTNNSVAAKSVTLGNKSVILYICKTTTDAYSSRLKVRKSV